MDKHYYFVLHTELMLLIWLEDSEDWSKRLLMDDLKNILSDTKYVGSVVFVEGSEDKDINKNNEDGSGGEVSWYITVSNILLYCDCYKSNIYLHRTRKTKMMIVLRALLTRNPPNNNERVI